MTIFVNGQTYSEKSFDNEEALERLVASNSKLLFGSETIYIDAKKKLEAKALGGTIPDGFLFNLVDPDNPEFYLIELELVSHDFFNHIFPQITKFFAFFKNPKSQKDLIDKIYSIVLRDDGLRDSFKKFLGPKEVFKFLTEVIENSPNILLILDGEKAELPEIMDTYSDTWGKMVKMLQFRQFINGDSAVYTIDPEFQDIDYAPAAGQKANDANGGYTEQYHLNGVKENVVAAYEELRSEILTTNKDVVFNAQHYYVAIVKDKTLCFIEVRKSKLRLIVMLPYEHILSNLKNHSVKKLSDSVQKWCKRPRNRLLICGGPERLGIDVLRK